MAAQPAAPTGAALLQAAPLVNPGHSVAIQFAASIAGEVSFEVFDVAGRRLHRSVRLVEGGREDVFDFDPDRGAGCYLYRLEIRGRDGSSAATTGKILTVD